MQGAIRGQVEVRSIRSDELSQSLAVIGGREFVGVYTPLAYPAHSDDSHVVLLRSGDQVALIVASDEDHVPHQFKTWEVVWKR